jgi:hypothetical protein
MQTRSRLEGYAGSCLALVQGHGPVRQPAVRGPENVGERVEGVAPLPELMELGGHLVEGVVLIAGAVLELLSPTSQDP